MKHIKWEAYLALCRKVETAGRGTDDSSTSPFDLALQQQFVDIFVQHLPPTSGYGCATRILAPGCLSECLPLAAAGYEVHALLLGPDNVACLLEKEYDDSNGGSIHVYEMDAHDLQFPDQFFDGYFSIQFHEHLLSWYVHLGEAYRCMRDHGIVFVDVAGYTPEMHMIWHTNLVPESVVADQWTFWGFKELWRDVEGDQRPRFVFRKQALMDPAFRHAGYLRWHLRLLAGDTTIDYGYNCKHCEGSSE